MENNGGKYSGFFSKKLRAGKRRTYFFDVRSTKQGDFFLTITESKKRFDSDGYEMHKIFLYKEDFSTFMDALNETVDYVKTELMPDYDFAAERQFFNQDKSNNYNESESGDLEKSYNSNGLEKIEGESFSNATEPKEKTLNEEDMSWN